MNLNQSFTLDICFSELQIIKFAEVSGDFNPIHFDDKAAEKLGFERKIVHGFLSSSVFSRIIGMDFPGNGSIYLSQTLKFIKPVYENVVYLAKVEIIDYIIEKKRFVLSTILIEKESDVTVINCESIVYNEKINYYDGF